MVTAQKINYSVANV